MEGPQTLDLDFGFTVPVYLRSGFQKYGFSVEVWNLGLRSTSFGGRIG